MAFSNTSPIPFWKRLIPFQKNRRSSPSTASTTEGLNNLDLCNEMMQRLDQLERRLRGEEPAYEGLLIVRERKKTKVEKDDKRR